MRKETVLVVGLDELATSGYDVSDINQAKLREIADAMHEASDDWYWNALQEVAEENDTLAYVAVQTGDYVVAGQPLIYTEAGESLSEADQTKLREAVFLQQGRGFDQDPNLGVVVLTEVASRALSPAVNDVQTAVDVVHRLSSVFLKAGEAQHEVRCTHVWIIPQSLEAMFAASFDVIARDGADAGELMAAIVESLGRIEAMGQGELPKLARATAARLNLG